MDPDAAAGILFGGAAMVFIFGTMALSMEMGDWKPEFRQKFIRRWVALLILLAAPAIIRFYVSAVLS